MIRQFRLHRANHADVIDAFGHARKQLAHFNAALAVLLELERRRKCRAGFALSGKIAGGQGFVRVFFQRRLRVKRIDVRRPAVEENVDDPFGPRGKQRRFRRQRIDDLPCPRFGWQQTGLRHQRREPQRAHAHAAFAQEVAPGQERVFETWLVVWHDGHY